MSKKTAIARVDYQRDDVPDWVREVIETGLAIEQEDARAAGSLGFMTRALVNATMPYKDPKTKIFERKNGDMTLTILSPNGVPYGKYPRLLMSFLVTEAVRRQSHVVVLGDSLTQFLKSTMGVHATGGVKGTTTRVSDQMQRLFTSTVSVGQRVISADGGRSFDFANISLVERGRLREVDMARLDSATAEPEPVDGDEAELWRAPKTDDEGKWNSIVELTPRFFKECIETPVPIDLRAYKVLSEAPMAMDIYAWTTYRASYLRRPTRPIPWVALQAQFGSGLPLTDQGTRDFKKAFKRNLDLVRLVNPGLVVDETSDASGLVLLPSAPSVPPTKRLTSSKSTKAFKGPGQQALFDT